ncbi:MAG: PDZ domain-containing protein [Prevotellaceae bacterium]|jgi:tricorn protease|nr:PDZ domain-containing protein [Prevotellaceae bacterium]
MKKILFLVGLILSSYAVQAQSEARLLRFPSTNGTNVVFTYAGDLYTVPINGGTARKLTSDIGFEMFSHFSPDGRTIAFTAQYDGNTEVYTMPSTGGIPKRITYTTTFGRDDVSDRMGPNNIVTGWSPDGKYITYTSKQQAVGFRRLMFQVPIDGGLSEQIPLPEGGFSSYSPDGKQLAYNRVFREFRTWKYYEGGMADDIWVHDFNTHQTLNISGNSAQDIFPMWIGDEVFYISDRDRTMNLFSYNTKTKQTQKVTDFTEFDIKFPTCNGNYIVFENGGYIYKFDAESSRKAEKITVYLADDHIYSRSELKDVSKRFRSASVSPNGERIAINARGDVYNVPVKEGVTRNITATSGVHERDADWSPDGKWIAYMSDATGETEIYIQTPDGSEKPIQLTKDNDTYISGFEWSPDNKKIAYTDRKSNLYIADIATKKRTFVLKSEYGYRGVAYAWSPDAKWIAYSQPEANEMSVIYLYNIEQGKSYPVTDKWYSSRSPEFSKDGKYLFFVSSRDFNPIYARNEWNVIYTAMDKPYFAILSKETSSPFADTDDEVKIDEPKPTDTKKDAPINKDVKVDIDGIQNRIESLPVAVGNYYNLSSVNDKVYYTSDSSSKMYDLKAKKETDLGSGFFMGLSANGKKMLILQPPGKVYVIDPPSSKPNLDKPVKLDDMKVWVNYHEEWRQIFYESWRHYRDGFYVANMHGVDWEAMSKKYEVLLPYVNHRADLTYIIGEMIGELNVGHAYVNSGEMPKPKRIQTGLLGAQLSRDNSGYFRIDKILAGENWSKSLRSPLTEIRLNVNQGEYIVAIDGTPTNSVKDIYSLLVGKANTKVELTVNSKPNVTGARKIIVTPIADENPLYYYGWVQNNIRKVEKATNGRVGYIHIPDMGPEGMNEFSKLYYAQLDKEALIIDDRSNGGGNVSPIILERLARVPYRASMYSGVDHPSVVPAKTLVGPMVAIVDKYSMSDGDLFAYGFKKLGLGKVIGTRTWGGIVGISGSLPFIDGADLRVPFFTSYSIDTGKWIVEGEGVEPDIVVDNDPYKEWTGEDEQLNRAIEEILKDLKDRKPVPPIPAGADKSGKKQ